MTAHAPTSADVASVRHASLVRAGTDDLTLVARLVVARSFWGRFRGLMGRASLSADEGLYLPVNSIHMLFMRFPIDALFLGAPDADGSRMVVAAKPDLRPWRGLVLPVRDATGVVELPVGTIGRARLSVGDALRLIERPTT